MTRSIPLRNRLFLNYLAVLVLGMGLAALLAWRAVEGLYLETQCQNLLAQADLIAIALQGQPLPEAASPPYSQISNTAPGIHTRLLNPQGGIVYSLAGMPAQMAAPPAENSAPIPAEQLKARTEIAAAVQGRSATSVRTVAGRRILYAAAPVMANDGSVEGVVYLAMPLPPAGLPATVIWQFAGACLFAILLALAAGTWLARRITSPVEAIASASAAVSGGDLAQQVSTDSHISELDSLGRSFNRMTEGLRQADRLKNAFVADVTHELRTPLTVIKGTLETLEDGALDDVEGRGPLLKSMQSETERLIRLVNELLLLTRADAGALALEICPLDLLDLVRDRCTYLSPLAARSGVKFAVTGPESVAVLADADRTSQVLDNLLDNAVRYSPPASEIAVGLSEGQGEFWCAVHDCGPGIGPQHLPFIFDRFYRADASRNRRTGGAGLGLSIARALVLAQGGQIRARSQEGAGTTIEFSLPAARVLPSD